MRYAVIYEQTPRNWAAYVPDLPGCVATGATRTDVERLILEAIVLHLDAMRQSGAAIPQSTAGVDLIEI